MTQVLLAHGFFLRNDPKQRQKMNPYPPLGTLYAAAMLRRAGYSVALFDAMFQGGLGDFEALLESLRPPVVALYEDTFHFLNKMCLTHVREATCEMAEMAREAGAQVVVAGSDVTDHPEVFVGGGAELGILGEGDHTLVEVVRHLLDGDGDGSDDDHSAKGALEDIDGLAYLGDDGELRRTRPRQLEKHPETFPHPAWDLIDVEPYRRAWRDAHGYFSLNMVTTRGCPFHCNWCAKPIWGQRYAMRTPVDVAEEMARLKILHAPDHLWFADDIFGIQHRWVSEFADEVEARDASIPFMIQSRVDLMRPASVAALARAGCVEVWLGVESGSQKILDAMDKGTRVSDIPAVRRRLQGAGIRCCFFLQFGYPGETWDDVMATVELVRRTLPDQVGISVSYPLPGTKFHRMVVAQIGDQDHWHDSNDLAMMFRGTYTTPFYRELHEVLHLDLDLRLAWAETDGEPPAAETRRLDARWRRLRRMEQSCRSEGPTRITKDYARPESPDLSRTWA